MEKVIVFAGTTEGYELCRFLSEHQISVYACAATEYGGKALTETPYLHIHTGRLSREEMEAFFLKEAPNFVLDATHPYAAEVTDNIKSACEKTGFFYQRVLREQGRQAEKAVYVESTEAAAEFLNTTEGNVLLTTGSKELKKFLGVKDYKERLYARVLSLPSVMEECSAAGFEGKHLIGMQGPFSRELNEAMLRQFHCRYLVTKDSGKAGGFQEKIDAAFSCGAIPVIIGRPLKEEGLSLVECKKWLSQNLGFSLKPQITLLGIGMGSRDTLTIEGEKALEKAELLIGARRIADSVKMPHHTVIYEYDSEKILKCIEENSQYEHIVIALSGDVGFYSGAKKLLHNLGEDTRVICGISSVVYFMAKAGLSWDDAKIVSAHGRNCNLVSLICHSKKVFSILGTKDGISSLAGRLVSYGMGDVLLYVGENLSYENEKIFVKPARELVSYEGDALCVVCAYNENASELMSTHGIKDECFIRGKAPMTKEEVRTVSLMKLGLSEDSVCYDVGAGTGSVAVEMALRAHQGKVYAIEKKEDALALILENKKKFAADNLEIVGGCAPEAMEELPVPTHAFIGGSSGNLKDIIRLLLNKNPEVKIVINCITLETVGEAMEAIREFDFQERDIVQMSVSRSKEVGRYHMMMGENPIYIFTCRRASL
ncbi:putative cobalt-precorrin-6Y C(15)-methyltransferase [decarboxylating] [uncultured Blautia sp.]